MICPAAQRDFDNGRALGLGWERWLLFHGAAATFAFASFGGAGRGNFTCLHEFADISVTCQTRLDEMIAVQWRLTIARICCRLRAFRAPT
jgi:hypothetical protein